MEAIEALGYKIDEELYTAAEALEKHHTRARYPGTGLAVYNKRAAGRCIAYAEKVRRFVEEILGGKEENSS